MLKRLTQVVLMSVIVLTVAALAAAQQTMQPMVRLGNFIEVGSDVFMHIIASADIRYRTVHNWDFEDSVRDRSGSRSPSDTTIHEGDSDLLYAELRLGVEARYQKNLSTTLLFEHQQVFDGNLIDDRANTSNPGGTDVFGRAPSTENPGFHIERFWIDYLFPSIPLHMRVGADLWAQDQAGLVGDDDPRFALLFESGNFGAMAAAVYQFESQRLGLENDNDFIYYTFSGWYNLKPHRFQLDVTYFRDRFQGADTGSSAIAARSGLGFQGQKTDSVLIMASWSGTFGPVRALLQGNILTGTAEGGTAGLPPAVTPGRDYDILAGSAVAYAEAHLGIARPFVGVVFGTADGDPSDRKLHGFNTLPVPDITLITGIPFFSHLDTSNAFAPRDYSCPARLQGLTNAVPGGTTPAGLPRPTSAIGTTVLAGGVAGSAATDCAHTTGNPFNDRIGIASHLGIITTYSNPGTIVVPAGVRVFPLKGHEITGWYVYRAMVKTNLIEVAFAPELGGRGIRKTQYHEVGGFWQWTLNPYFDIRLSGNIAIPGEGYKDIARLADCNPAVAGVQACNGDDIALTGEARVRARF
jgi:hypothetical protein